MCEKVYFSIGLHYYQWSERIASEKGLARLARDPIKIVAVSLSATDYTYQITLARLCAPTILGMFGAATILAIHGQILHGVARMLFPLGHNGLHVARVGPLLLAQHQARRLTQTAMQVVVEAFHFNLSI